MAAPINTALRIPGCNKKLQSDLTSDRMTDFISCNCSVVSCGTRYIF